MGITLSPVQARRAGERAAEQGIALLAWENFDEATEPAVQFQVTNALKTPFPDNSFDFVWSMESGEHMPDKQGFLRECYRLLKPGGTFLMATWCHRATDTLAGPLTSSEQNHLDMLYDLYHLPYVISLDSYSDLATAVGFEDIRLADWSRQVEFFWQDVVRSAMDLNVVAGILRAGSETIRGDGSDRTYDHRLQPRPHSIRYLAGHKVVNKEPERKGTSKKRTQLDKPAESYGATYSRQNKSDLMLPTAQ